MFDKSDNDLHYVKGSFQNLLMRYSYKWLFRNVLYNVKCALHIVHRLLTHMIYSKAHFFSIDVYISALMICIIYKELTKLIDKIQA